MKIVIGELSFDVEEIDNLKMTYSKLTLEQLHSFEAKLYVDNRNVKEFEHIFDEYKVGEIYISDEELKLDNSKFNAEVKKISSSNTTEYKSYYVRFEECCRKAIKAIEFEGQRLEAYEISQKIEHNAVIIDAKVIVTKEQFEMIRQLRYGDVEYFPVTRIDIDDTPLLMRFGRNLWSEKDGIIKMSLIFVEKEYDREKAHLHGLAEPQLSIAIKQIKQLRAINKRLLNVLFENKLITDEQKKEIEEELTVNELKQEHYLYDQVKDIDEWR